MKMHRKRPMGPAVLILVATAPFSSAAALAQSVGDGFAARHPELAALFDGAFLAQATAFREMAAINESETAAAAREGFERGLRMRAGMTMADMMAMMSMEPSLPMAGPYDEQESSISAELLSLLSSSPGRLSVRSAYDASPLGVRAVEVIRAGRSFETEVYEILADRSVGDKQAALGNAVEAYLAGDASLPAQPRRASLLLDHPHAGAYARGFPKLSRILWSAQWLQLATIEAMLLAEEDSQFWGGTDIVSERFDSMIAGSGGTSSTMPTELPTVPAIAPTLLSTSPEVAAILDNLSMFETVLADTVSWPNLENRNALIEDHVDRFTSRDDEFDTMIEYVVSALRGGIYNQGGPAVGELSASERNRSRSEMNMQHAMVMSSQ